MNRVLTFFLVSAGLRFAHALLTPVWHLDGDMGLPWLMLNDWDHTLSRRHYWGQSYLGTYEIAALAWLGRLFWGAGSVIPPAFYYLSGQLLAVAGGTLVFATLRRIRPRFGDAWLEFAAAVALLGFAVPSLQKFSFSLAGYSLTPLVTGIGLWVWSTFAARDPETRTRWVLLFAGGVVLGLAQTVLRLNLLPVLALGACGVLIRFQQPRSWAALAAGVLAGALPEFAMGLERSGPGSVALLPLIDRWHRFASSLSQLGVAMGTLPYTTVEPEDALFFRGHSPVFPHLLLDILSVVLLVALIVRRKRDRGNAGTWMLWALIALNVALITVNAAPNDLYTSRRYGFPAMIALSGLLLLSIEDWLARSLIALRAAGLGVYLYSSLTFASPIQEMRGIFAGAGFDPARDCLSGSGGDLSAISVNAGLRFNMISHKWRLAGNDSLALFPTDLQAIRARCRSILHVDTGETRIAEASPYCATPARIYEEPVTPRYRPPVRLFRCG